jgi:hypothetical protein
MQSGGRVRSTNSVKFEAFNKLEWRERERARYDWDWDKETEIEFEKAVGVARNFDRGIGIEERKVSLN